MDSPVIMNAASKFGREIDLDRCSFPGFPFDDDAADVFERPRGDGIRAHLDDLAARHPEFAEHLRGPPWPFGGSLLRDRRCRRHGSGGSNDDQQQGQQHQVDEDARSQASGSSAASGASAVSSHSGGGGGGSGGGEHDLTSSSAIPQYGLRNTVDIGQQQRRCDMEMSPEKGERGQRSMSAPPESWQQQQDQPQGQDQQSSQPGQGQRFVSRVDITPQHNQQQQRAQSPSKPASNVRHIPIFVEGRDVPVMPKIATDDAPSSTFQQHYPQRQPSPPSHHFDRSSPPAHHFHRPSHFNERFSRQQWPPSHFQDAFYKPAAFEQPIRKQQQPPQYHYQQPQSHQQQPQHHHQQYQQPQSHHEQQHQQQPQQHHQQYQQPQSHHEQHHQQQQFQQPQHHQEQQQQQQHQEAPKPKPPVPKDALERVALVQKEVDYLADQVRRYVGGSRQDKEYIYLDEMLTRELIKLDDIETEGRENVRQARKNAIKTIQDTISLLESKTPIINQQEQQPTVHEEVQESAEKDQRGEETSQVPEPMEIDAKQEKQSNEPIPLPPGPSSPTKAKVESSESEIAATAAKSTNQNVVPPGQQDIEQKIENLSAENMKQLVALMSTDESTKCVDEMSKESKQSDGKDGEQRKDGDVSQTMTKNKYATSKQQTKEATEGKTEANDEQRSSMESPRSQKKTKKTKKKEQQQPVSEQAIPLPPPSTESAK